MAEVIRCNQKLTVESLRENLMRNLNECFYNREFWSKEKD